MVIRMVKIGFTGIQVKVEQGLRQRSVQGIRKGARPQVELRLVVVDGLASPSPGQFPRIEIYILCYNQLLMQLILNVTVPCELLKAY